MWKMLANTRHSQGASNYAKKLVRAEGNDEQL